MSPSDNSAFDPMLQRAVAFSPFLRRLAGRPPASWRPSLVQQPINSQEISRLLGMSEITDEPSLWQRLRLTRQHVFLTLATRDLAGLADLTEVLTTVTTLANESVRFALERLLPAMEAIFGAPIGEDSGRRQQLIVVGMGKLGGEELNVSSDIDLIFIYPEEGVTFGPKSISNHEYFTRLGRKLIAALSEPTPDGFVFRVDMRLRPYGDSGPLVASLSMLENYFHTQAREWERYAWLKARPLCANAAGLQEQIGPFVFRRHLDYSAIDSLRALHNQIREEVKRKDIAGNIKLGPGGIREIEFIAQVFQLVRGGQDAALRDRSTRGALRLLKDKRLLPPDVVEELHEAYVFLRNLEHRLQYVEDQQTQTLPADAEALARLAQSMGYHHSGTFLQALRTHRDRVSSHFEGIFAGEDRSEDRHAQANLWEGRLARDESMTQLQVLGYREPEGILRRITGLREGGLYRRMSATTQSRLDALGPRILASASAQTNADATFERLLTILESIGRREAYLALLQEYVGRVNAWCDWRAPVLGQQATWPGTPFYWTNWSRTASRTRPIGQCSTTNCRRPWTNWARHSSARWTWRAISSKCTPSAC